MINVVCVQWGRKYSNEYVTKLYNSIERNTSVPFDFITCTDNAERPVPGFKDIFPKDNIQSWYNKLQMFYMDKHWRFEQTFFFDLDTVIVGNLDEIFGYRGNFCALRDFYRRDGLGSGLLSWKTGEHEYIWDYYKGRKHRLGDQGIIEDATSKNVDRWQELYKDQIISYKVHCKPTPPDNARIVCFHGKPNPHEVKGLKWVTNAWQ
jgi:hypothetical protein